MSKNFTINLMNISEKILQLIDKKGITKKSVYDFLKITRQTFDTRLEKNRFNNDELEKLSTFFNVDRGYFFGAQELEMTECYKIPVKAYAGFLSNGFENIQVMAHELETVAVPKKMVKNPQKTLVFEVFGDSMQPELDSEDYVAAELVEDWFELKKGNIYVVVTNEDIVIKLLHALNANSITLESRNKEYKNISVEKTSIKYIFRVLGKFKWYV